MFQLKSTLFTSEIDILAIISHYSLKSQSVDLE